MLKGPKERSVFFAKGLGNYHFSSKTSVVKFMVKLFESVITVNLFDYNPHSSGHCN